MLIFFTIQQKSSNIYLQFWKICVIIDIESQARVSKGYFYEACPTSHQQIQLSFKKGIIMNYYEWSLEYEQSAKELEKVITRLKKRRAHISESEKKEINERIAFYKSCRSECIQTADLLMRRHKGVA